MNAHVEDTDALLTLAASGDAAATERLFVRHREKLRQMVAARLDSRVTARVDPSDVVQETLMEASQKLNRYLAERPLPFYPWLRRLALERLVELNRRQIYAEKRDPAREVPAAPALSGASTWQLADRLLAVSAPGPADRAMRAEERRRVHKALEKLLPHDREVLVLRYLEQLSTADTAAVLGVSESAVKMRHLRALERMRALIEKPP